MMPAEATETPVGVLIWAVIGLCTVVATLGAYIAGVHRSHQRAYKDEREMMVKVVTDNTAAMTRLGTVVENVQQTLNLYIHTER